MIPGARRVLIVCVPVLVSLIWRPTSASDAPHYCLTISVGLRSDLREEVSGIDIVINNASVTSIPRFPKGWGIKVQNYVDNTPTKIFGGATGSVAELQEADLRCLFEIRNDVPGKPAIIVTGSIYISDGRNERRLNLDKSQVILEKIGSR